MNLGTAFVLVVVIAVCALAAKSVFGKKGSCHCSDSKEAARGSSRSKRGERDESAASVGCSPSACAGCVSAGCCGAAKIYGINDFPDASPATTACPNCN